VVAAWLGRSLAPDADLLLLCLAHAGGGGSFFRPWQAELAPAIDVRPIQLPGREARLREPAYHRMSDLIGPLLDGVAPQLDRPYAVFGHSMGAAIGFELARLAGARGLPPPVRLLVSGRRAPHLPARRAAYDGLDDEAFLRSVFELGGTPSEVVQQRELLQLFLPTMRADFLLNDSYEPLPGPRLSCPISAFVGDSDAEASPAEVAGWAQVTTGPCSARVFPGGHFYLKEQQAEVLAAVTEALRSDRERRPVPPRHHQREKATP
jgi:medium-chain acyl-[acyl-carrier-protein] hydrolase